MTFRPMLAGKAPADLSALRYPLIASPKIDGIRCLITEAGAVTRSLKPIPNRAVRDALADLPIGLDGEIVALDRDGEVAPFQTTQGVIMSAASAPRFAFLVFDRFDDPETPYATRYASLAGRGRAVRVLPSIVVRSADRLSAYEDGIVSAGGEGVMIRRPDGPYKFGRSTTSEAILLKLKRFEDSEGIVIGFSERQHNANEATTNAIGRTQRSSAAAGKRGLDTLGALRLSWKGVEFDVGSGIADAERDRLWGMGSDLLGAAVTFRYQTLTDAGLPRFPVYGGMRSDL